MPAIETETTQAKTEAAQAKKLFPSSSGSMFQNYFGTGREESYNKRELIDARGRRLFENAALACSLDVYPFQQAMSTRPGPTVQVDGHTMLLLSSYDYLGLIGHPRIDEAAIAAIRKYGTGTGGARLMTGTIDLHAEAEAALAAYKGTEAALTFTSGYAANLAAIGACFGPADRAIADALCHRSLYDACRFAGVQMKTYEHNDPASLRRELEKPTDANRTLIITDGVFSMDGDIGCLPELIALKEEFGCFLLVDESHATGVIGKRGRGTDEHFGVPTEKVDIWTGSLAKSVPSTGGFVAVSQRMSIFLQHAAAPFIFSGAMPAPMAATVVESLKILAEEPERVALLQVNSDFLRDGLQSLGYNTGLSETAVVPVLLKDDVEAAFTARKLRDLGVLASPVLFPAVAQGGARLRLCVTAAHTQAHLEQALDAFDAVRNQ